MLLNLYSYVGLFHISYSTKCSFDIVVHYRRKLKRLCTLAEKIKRQILSNSKCWPTRSPDFVIRLSLA